MSEALLKSTDVIKKKWKHIQLSFVAMLHQIVCCKTSIQLLTMLLASWSGFIISNLRFIKFSGCVKFHRQLDTYTDHCSYPMLRAV